MPAGFERMTKRLRPLRVRLTVAFASVVAIVLAVTGALVFVEFSRDLQQRTDDELGERQAVLAGLAAERRTPSAVIALSGEAYSQIYSGDGRVLASSRLLVRARLLTTSDVARAAEAPLIVDRPVPGSDEGARVRAFASSGDRVIAIAEPLDDRERELGRLALLLSIALPAALLLASIAGYQVARGALLPVDRMRLRAASIGAGDLTQRLPRPGTDDELDRLAVTLNELLDHLAGALERERRIVGDASHELRTPIAVLRTRIEVALLGARDIDRFEAALQEAGRDADRLSRLAEDLLVLARADRGQLPLRLEPLDVLDVMETTLARHGPDAEAVGRALTIGAQVSGGAVVLADPDRVAQVLDNLVVNALRYGGGTIELSATADPADERVELHVRDHGAGLPPEFLPRAFERFSQAGGSASGEGSGLGLAIVEALMLAQGGLARVGNHPVGGAVATITLPRA